MLARPPRNAGRRGTTQTTSCLISTVISCSFLQVYNYSSSCPFILAHLVLIVQPSILNPIYIANFIYQHKSSALSLLCKELRSGSRVRLSKYRGSRRTLMKDHIPICINTMRWSKGTDDCVLDPLLTPLAASHRRERRD